MKITNTSARMYYIGGQKMAPGQTAEVEDKWGDNPTVKSSISSGELKLASKDEEVTSSPVEKIKKDAK